MLFGRGTIHRTVGIGGQQKQQQQSQQINVWNNSNAKFQLAIVDNLQCCRLCVVDVAQAHPL